MKHLSLTFLALVCTAASLYFSRLDASPESRVANRSKATPLQVKALPLTLESVRQITPPENLTSLHADTEKETDLLASLAADKSVARTTRIESVNCERARCQVIAKPLASESLPALQEHLAAHPEFGYSLRVSPMNDKKDKTLVTLLYSQETQVSTTH